VSHFIAECTFEKKKREMVDDTLLVQEYGPGGEEEEQQGEAVEVAAIATTATPSGSK
jgi:hypothetical protein